MGVYSTLVQESALAEVRVKNFADNLSFMECTMYSLAESEHAWNQIMEGVAIEELAVLESTGQEMVYEAANKESFFAKIINWFKEKWSAIAGLFRKALAWIDSKIKDDKKFVEKYGVAITAGYANIPADGIKIDGYKYENLIDGIDYKSAMKTYDKYANIDGNYVAILSGQISDSGRGASKEYIQAQKENREENLNKIRATVIGMASGSEIKASDFAAEVKKYLCGTAVSAFKKGEFAPADIIKELKEAKDTKNTLKKNYADLKAFMDGAIKKVEEAKKAVSKASKDSKNANATADGERMAMANVVITLLKDVSSIYSTANGVQISCFTKYVNQTKAIAYQLVKLYDVSKDHTIKSTSSSDADSDGSFANQESATFQTEEMEKMFKLDLI